MGSSAVQVEKLSPEQRLRLIEELWESLRKDPASVPLTESQRKELDRRLDELERGETETIPWAEVKRQARDSSQ